MKVLLSPAKSMNENPNVNGIEKSTPIFNEETEYLAKKMAKLSARQIKKLMSVNNDLAELNYDRYQNWGEQDENPAGYMFSGAAYQGLDFTSLSKKEQLIGQEKIRILSGLYGIIRPLDLIQPYRLEMGCRFKVTAKITNLYKYWGDKIRIALDEELAKDKEPILVNCASSEYFKAAQLDKMKARVVTTVFKDKAKDGSYKVNMTYAKQARGYMTRYIVQNNCEAVEELKGFDAHGYKFVAKESSENELVYLRDKPQ